jgi:hypothetical protein
MSLRLHRDLIIFLYELLGDLLHSHLLRRRQWPPRAHGRYKGGVLLPC